MSNKKVYLIGFVVLLLSNAILIFLLIQKPKRPDMRPRQGQNSIIEKISNQLQLTDDQKAEYQLMAQDHGKQMRILQQNHRGLMKNYFETLVTTESADSLKNEILKVESEKLQYTYDHFEQLKSVLTTSQQQNFELILQDILVVLLGGENKLPPPPRD